MSRSIRITDTPACDGCKVRKIKCNRNQPCRACDKAALECTYNSVPLRRGPPRKKSHRLIIPDSSSDIPGRVREEQATESLPETKTSNNARSQVSDSEQLRRTSPRPGTISEHSVSPPLDPSKKAPWQDHCRPSNRIESTILQAHVHVFLKHMFPIMPILDPNTVLHDCTNPDALPDERYAFLAALCAVTHIQLKLSNFGYSDTAQERGHPEPSLSSNHGEFFIEEVLRTRHDSNTVDYPNCTVLLTSFFLFAAYGNLNKATSALFYLHQAISLALTLKLNDEETYTMLSTLEAERQRAVYWLLFITERYISPSSIVAGRGSKLMFYLYRAYCLQIGKPVILSPCIRRPQPTNPEYSPVYHGFSSLINLFVKLDSTLYGLWFTEPGYLHFGRLNLEPAVVNTIGDLSTFEPSVTGMLDTQRVDVLVTRDWLRVYLLVIDFNFPTVDECRRLAFSRRDLQTVLLSCAKSIMETISSAPQSCISAHEIGMVRHP